MTKEENNRPHLQSNHAIAGAVASVLLFVQVILGLLQNPKFGIVASPSIRRSIKQLHGICSYLLVFVVSVTMWFAFQTNYFQKRVLKDDPALSWLSSLFGLAVPSLVLVSGLSSA